jgi:superoxide dismutase, Cu-Zn family
LIVKQVTLAAGLIAGLLGGCASLGDLPTAKLATATLRTANGLPAGTALLTAAGDKLTLTIAVAGLPTGPHGIHLHLVGRCGAPDFVSAGGHLNPGARQHGAQNPAGSHLGDLPNITIDNQGKGTLSVELDASRESALGALFDSDGSAIVIHSAADDYKTDPTGNSGARIVCGVLQRS